MTESNDDPLFSDDLGDLESSVPVDDVAAPDSPVPTESTTVNAPAAEPGEPYRWFSYIAVAIAFLALLFGIAWMVWAAVWLIREMGKP
jgi:hypothetical protein